MMILMSDRVHWFGDGVYDAGPCRNYHIFAIDEHVDRFFNSAALMDIKMPVIKDQLKDLLNELVKKMDTRNSFVYYSIMKEILVTSSSNPCLWCNNAQILRTRMKGTSISPVRMRGGRIWKH